MRRTRGSEGERGRRTDGEVVGTGLGGLYGGLNGEAVEQLPQKAGGPNRPEPHPPDPDADPGSRVCLLDRARRAARLAASSPSTLRRSSRKASPSFFFFYHAWLAPSVSFVRARCCAALHTLYNVDEAALPLAPPARSLYMYRPFLSRSHARSRPKGLIASSQRPCRPC